MEVAVNLRHSAIICLIVKSSIASISNDGAYSGDQLKTNLNQRRIHSSGVFSTIKVEYPLEYKQHYGMRSIRLFVIFQAV